MGSLNPVGNLDPAQRGNLGLTRRSIAALLGSFILITPRTLLFGTLLLLPLAAGAKSSKSASDSGTIYASKLKSSAVSAIPASTSDAPSKIAKISALDTASTKGGSMYDPSTARKISPDMLHIFGPKSAGVHYDARMINAAKIAEDRARKHSIRSCWRYVKTALLAANVVESYPKTTYAKQAGDELQKNHGFRKLSVNDPFKAPVGSVLVYGGRGAGHVEIRTVAGFVSDFESPTPSKRPLLGVFVKPG